MGHGLGHVTPRKFSIWHLAFSTVHLSNEYVSKTIKGRDFTFSNHCTKQKHAISEMTWLRL